MNPHALRFARATGGALVALGALALLGWVLDSDALRSVVPGGVAVNPLTALCFGGLGLALIWARHAARTVPASGREDGVPSGVAVGATALFLIIAAGSRLLAYVGGPDVGLDRILFADALAEQAPPNVMAPNTAIAFALCAAALVLVYGRRRLAFAGQLVALAAGIIGLITLTGYAFGVNDLIGMRSYIPMAFVTGFGFVLASAGILMVRPDAGLVREASARTAGGRTFRRIAPALVLLPPLLSWIAVRGVRAELFGSGVAITVAVVFGTLVMVGLLTANARLLNREETARVAAERKMRSLVRDLRRKSAELTAANAELEAFSYSVSHDLRAPLRSITSFSQILLEDHDARLDDEGRDYLRRVVRGGARMSELIDDLIELARVSRGELARSEVDVSALASAIVEEMHVAEPLRTVRAMVQPGLEVWADPRLVRVVLTNLIDNAWKYTGRVAEPRVQVGALPRAGTGTSAAALPGGDEAGSVAVVDPGPIVFFVRDNGAGFDMQHAARLFTPFQRLHRSEDYAGTGVGLATVRRIVHRHGGRVWAEASPGAGATFYFTLNPGSEA